MSIPVRAMHEEVRDNYLGEAERTIKLGPEGDDYSHPVAGRDAVRLAYCLFEEAGNGDIWEEAREKWDVMRIAEKNAAKAASEE